MYILIGIASIKTLSLHSESWLHDEDNIREIGSAVAIFPLIIIFDGICNIGIYELGLITKN